MRIIREDEVWSGRVVLDGGVQIAPGATVTVRPGTIVEGRNQAIDVFGTFEVLGRPNRPVFIDHAFIDFETLPGSQNVVRMRHAHVDGGGFLTWQGGGTGGHVSVSHTLFTRTDRFTHILYADDRSHISDSLFLTSRGVSVGTFGRFAFEDNLVWNQVAEGGRMFALRVVTDTGGEVVSSGNAYLSGDRIALLPDSPTVTIRSVGDLFGDGRAATREAMILDRNDDLTRGAVAVEAPASAPAQGLATSIRAYADVDMPPAVLRDVRLQWNRDADVFGNALANVIVGNGGDNRLEGEGGDDQLNGKAGADTLVGDAGADRILGGRGRDALSGGSGGDTINGGGGNDRIGGERGRDDLSGGSGGDTIEGGGGNDRIRGERGPDDLSGGSGGDTIEGGGGNDRIDGGGGKDRLDGGAGRDVLVGGGGNDRLAGGRGADVFLFDAPRWGRDRITDWSDRDAIDLSALGIRLRDISVSVRGRDVIASVDDGGRGSVIVIEDALGAIAPDDVIL